ncbi:MAG: phosphatase PAP2 family protein [Gemmatimonadales bacterium]
MLAPLTNGPHEVLIRIGVPARPRPRAGGRARTRRLVLLVALVAAVRPAAAQTHPGAPDSTGHSRGLHVTRREWAVLGGTVAATALLAPMDETVQRMMRQPDLQRRAGLRRDASILAFVGGPGPFVAGAALYAIGRGIDAPGVAALGVHLTEGVLLAASINALGKGIAGRALPDSVPHDDAGQFSFGRGFHDNNGDFVSFPSGHTAAAFATAAVLTAEAERWRPGNRWVAPVAYGGAVVVGAARLYQNVHWVSDLPLAALIGTWSGLAVVHRAHAGGSSRLERWLLGTTVTASHGGAALRWSSGESDHR